MTEHKPHTGFKIAASVLDFFGVAAASLAIVILMLLISSLYTSVSYTHLDVYKRQVQIVPIEVIVRNIAAGSLSKRIGYPEGTKLKSTVLEYCYKNDDLGDPMINETHIAAMGLATKEEMDDIASMALKVNEVLTDYLKDLNIELIDFKLEFGKTADGTIVLADEISPDTCRFWDSVTHEKLDKDRFRRDLGGVEDAYHEIMKRLMGE